MLRALFKQGSFWTITNEKTFMDLGSGFVVKICVMKKGDFSALSLNT